jgi:hypothetical protein
MADFCPICGANREVVGRVHRCVPAVVARASEPVTHTPAVTHAVTHKALTNAERQARWRKANAELCRLRNRDRMRRQRSHS